MHRTIYLATVVVALPVFLCAASPAIRAIQQQVDALQAQTDSLQAQTDRLPIVVDGGGEILGDVVDGTGAGPVSWTGQVSYLTCLVFRSFLSGLSRRD